MALCRKWRRNLAQPLVHRFRDGNGSLENSFSAVKRVRLEAILFFFCRCAVQEGREEHS